VHDVAPFALQVVDLGTEVTSYERIGVPPSFVGANHFTTTRPVLKVAVTLRGALAIKYGDVDEELVKNSRVVWVASWNVPTTPQALSALHETSVTDATSPLLSASVPGTSVTSAQAPFTSFTK
jgi:hypothetical protein